MTEKNISNNAKKAEKIKNEMPEEVKAAAEAMERTARAKRPLVYLPQISKYQQIY